MRPDIFHRRISCALDMTDESALDDTDEDSEEEKRRGRSPVRRRHRNTMHYPELRGSVSPESMLSSRKPLRSRFSGDADDFALGSNTGQSLQVDAGALWRSRRNSLSSVSDRLSGLEVSLDPPCFKIYTVNFDADLGLSLPGNKLERLGSCGSGPLPPSRSRYSALDLPGRGHHGPSSISTTSQPIPIPGARRDSSIARSRAEAGIAHSPRPISLGSTLPELPPLRSLGGRMMRPSQPWPDFDKATSSFLPLRDDSGFVSVSLFLGGYERSSQVCFADLYSTLLACPIFLLPPSRRRIWHHRNEAVR